MLEIYCKHLSSFDVIDLIEAKQLIRTELHFYPNVKVCSVLERMDLLSFSDRTGHRVFLLNGKFVFECFEALSGLRTFIHLNKNVLFDDAAFII
jgi:hypothetical protein